MVIPGQSSVTTTNAVVADARAFDNMTATTTDAVVADARAFDNMTVTTAGAVVVAVRKYRDSDVRFVFYAPAGKLGVVVDTPDEGAPMVHIVKENSVLIGQVKVGDRLIGVDEIDVQSFTPIKVSKLMSQRSTNSVRKLTFTRGKLDVDDAETAYGRETASQVKSTIQVDTDTQGENHGMTPRIWRVGSMSHICGAEENGTSSVVDDMKVHPQLPLVLRVLLFTITLLLILMILFYNIYRK
jgi:hypothetical protein